MTSSSLSKRRVNFHQFGYDVASLFPLPDLAYGGALVSWRRYYTFFPPALTFNVGPRIEGVGGNQMIFSAIQSKPRPQKTRNISGNHIDGCNVFSS